jgi:hypothetical protein
LNIYEKLLEARVRFHKREIKKTGWNDYGKYEYFELSDFLVPALEIFSDLRMIPLVTFSADAATMKIVDLEKPEDFIIFNSPFVPAELKATNAMQQIGAAQTFARRYLYVTALDIVEHDEFDASSNDAVISLMESAATIKELQDIFADAYQAADKDRKAVLKEAYDNKKDILSKGGK